MSSGIKKAIFKDEFCKAEIAKAANSNENSHMLDVPLGVSMITDVLIASPIINEMADMGGAANVGGGAPGMPAQS